jgi:RNA polymerase sigma-70 factor, ECF subfamily
MANEPPEKTDEQVVEEILGGNTDAFAILVQRYEPKLKRYGWRFLSQPENIEDIVQNVFLSVYENLRSFDLKRRFSPWIYRIAHNAFVNALKKRPHEPLPFFDPEVLFPHPLSLERPDRDLERKDLKEMLDKLLSEISEKYREPLILFYLQELDYATIAEILHLPISTVGVRISRGRTQLKKISEAKGYTT